MNARRMNGYLTLETRVDDLIEIVVVKRNIEMKIEEIEVRKG